MGSEFAVGGTRRRKKSCNIKKCLEMPSGWGSPFARKTHWHLAHKKEKKEKALREHSAEMTCPALYSHGVFPVK